MAEAAEPTAYQARVPAVARAVLALEHLAAAQQPLSLSALARAIGVGPTDRLRGAAGATGRSLLGEVAASDGAWVGAGPIGPGELDAFLSQALVASLSYLSDDGYPASVPLWYDWDGRAFWLVPSPGAEWAVYARRNPRVSLSISESTLPLRRVLARVPIVAVV